MHYGGTKIWGKIGEGVIGFSPPNKLDFTFRALNHSPLCKISSKSNKNCGRGSAHCRHTDAGDFIICDLNAA